MRLKEEEKMRETKYRGRRRDKGGWVYGFYVARKGIHKTTHSIFTGETASNETDWCVKHEIDSETLGQYLGLKDKNGKEIYEGDIVNRYWHEAYAPDIWEVKWDAPNVCFFLFNKNGKDWLYEDPLEIIGNIFENPELLENALKGEKHGR